MSVFKYLILTAVRLKYNVGEALLLSSERYLSARSSRCQRQRATDTDGEEKKKTLLFLMTILLPCALSDWSWRLH